MELELACRRDGCDCFLQYCLLADSVSRSFDPFFSWISPACVYVVMMSEGESSRQPRFRRKHGHWTRFVPAGAPRTPSHELNSTTATTAFQSNGHLFRKGSIDRVYLNSPLQPQDWMMLPEKEPCASRLPSVFCTARNTPVSAVARKREMC